MEQMLFLHSEVGQAPLLLIAEPFELDDGDHQEGDVHHPQAGLGPCAVRPGTGPTWNAEYGQGNRTATPIYSFHILGQFNRSQAGGAGRVDQNSYVDRGKWKYSIFNLYSRKQGRLGLSHLEDSRPREGLPRGRVRSHPSSSFRLLIIYNTTL